MSASRAPPQAASTIAVSRRFLGANMPGVSMKTSWLSPSLAMPRTGTRVVCTLCETIDTLAPTSALTSVDLPALGAPMTAMKPQRCSAIGGVPLFCSTVTHAIRLRRRLRAPAARGRRPARPRASRRPRRAPARMPSMRTSEVKRGAWSGPLRLDLDVLRAALGLCPAPIPAGPTWRRGRRRSCADRPGWPTGGAPPNAPVEAGVEEDGAEDRLHGVGEDRALGAAAAPRLAVRQDEMLPQAQRRGRPWRRLRRAPGGCSGAPARPRWPRESARSAASAMARPSTRSPMNSSRSLSLCCSLPPRMLACVSAISSSSWFLKR